MPAAHEDPYENLYLVVRGEPLGPCRVQSVGRISITCSCPIDQGLEIYVFIEALVYGDVLCKSFPRPFGPTADAPAYGSTRGRAFPDLFHFVLRPIEGILHKALQLMRSAQNVACSGLRDSLA